MRIRSKLLALILVPLAALTLVAALGFRSQSVVIERSENAVDLATLATAVNDARLAVGAERLAYLSGTAEADLAATRERTDASLAQRSIAGSDGPIMSVSALVDQAREERPDQAFATLTKALEILADVDSADPEAFESSQILVLAAGTQLLEMIDQTDLAWGSLLLADPADPSALRAAASALDAAEAASEGAVEAERRQNRLDLAVGFQSFEHTELAKLGFSTVRSVESGTTSLEIDTAAIVALLQQHRSDWSEQVVAVDAHVVAETDRGLDRANGLRSLFALLGLVGIALLSGVVFVIYRSITMPLNALIQRAEQVANRDLPSLVDTLRTSGGIDELPVVVPIEVQSDDEIGELVAAFNSVQRTAYQLATEQALARRYTGELFVNLGRRNQALLQRILALLTDLESKEEDPETLRDLFELDNIVTRMRRNAESLLVLAGAQTPRQWSKPVAMDDSVRAALGEVERYDRIDIAALADARLHGAVVADISHLLAELLENALAFSDPSTRVLVSGQHEPDHYLITIFDQGIGMSQSEMEENNRRISDPPALGQSPSKFLGLFVVGRLAERHGILVRLVEAPGRGSMARVEIPSRHLVDVDVSESLDGDGPSQDVRFAAAAEVKAALVVRRKGDSIREPHIPEALPDRLVASTREAPTHAVPTPVAPVSDVPEPAESAEPPMPVASTPIAVSEPVAPLPSTTEWPASVTPDSVDRSVPPSLPSRNRGATLSDSPVLPNRRAGDPVSNSTAPQPDAAGSADAFSSLMSAFSSGVNRGLQDSEHSSVGGATPDESQRDQS